jgi:uncharacterized protein
MHIKHVQYLIIERIKDWLRICFLVIVAGCSSNTDQQKLNRLKDASSPYLKEHADNPVDWYEWGEEALQKAKNENKPLLISIGYSSCHWCHVMEKESFTDTVVARLMNESFICIKVDREERPDIDNLYLHACQLLNNGEAGWPLNAFALPDGKPFFAGTYYSKDNWIKLLKQISESYKFKKSQVLLQASSLTFGIIDNDSLFLQKGNKEKGFNKELYRAIFSNVKQNIDITHGGLRGQQKFPTPSLWNLLLQYHYLTGDQEALFIATNTLTKMALGGLYDQVGGGFARYTTDSLWRIPHFEKMLYDNGQMVSLYAKAYQLTKNNFFKEVLVQTLAFVDQEFVSNSGGLYSSLNADTEDGEGIFYSWSLDELKKITSSKNANLIQEYYNITQQGNWEKGRNILYATTLPEEFAVKRNIKAEEFNQLLSTTRKSLLEERSKRNKPTADTKILTSWNAIMLKGYADAYSATADKTYLQRALAIAVFLEKNMLAKDGKLMRNFKDGKVSVNAFLDDYAWLAHAYIKLYQVTFNKHWLTQAKKITDYALVNFYETTSGLFYYSSVNSTQLVLNKMEVRDNNLPSSNAIMATVLYELGVFFSEEHYSAKSSRMLSVVSQKMYEAPVYYTQWCWLSGLIAHGINEVVIMGEDAERKNIELQKKYLPTCFILGGTDKEDLPLLEGRLQDGKTMIYVCSDRICKLPVDEVDKALRQIK